MRRLEQVLNEGVEQGLHPGAQVYVSIEGETIASFAVGTADGQTPLTTDTPMLWMSAGKPLTALAIAQLVEQGELAWDDPVHTLVPCFDHGGKHTIQLRHLLTHSTGLEETQDAGMDRSWEDFALAACESSIRPGELPGTSAAYSPHANWAVLGLIIERVTCEGFAEHIQNLIVEPLAKPGETLPMWCGMDEATFDSLTSAGGPGLSVMADTSRKPGHPHPSARPLGWHEKAWVTSPKPGANTYATAAAMGRLYESLLAGGQTASGRSMLSPSTVETITARQRQDRFDATFRHVIDFGFGFLINSRHHGPDTVPYGYGDATSPATFGHSGSQSTVAFADPESQLVVAIAANGMPGEPRHQKRLRQWMQALEADLEAG